MALKNWLLFLTTLHWCETQTSISSKERGLRMSEKRELRRRLGPIWRKEHHHLTSWSWALLEETQIVQLLKNFKKSMEPEGSLPCSQEPSSGPYPEADWSSPYNLNLSLYITILMLFTHLRLCLSNDLFPSGFPTNILYAFLTPFVLHALHTSSSLSWSF
jgi:hypothetical protein